MDHAYEASTVVMDNEGAQSLQDQILQSKTAKPESQDIREKKPEKEVVNNAKKYVFSKGDQSVELDDDYEIEIMADKRPSKMTLRELRERAAGDVAVKNRMHSLAEEKKRVQATLKEFATLSKTDPLEALEYISARAKEADGEFEYDTYIQKLAEQAEKLGEMTDQERKLWEAEKKLSKAEENLSLKEREEAVVLRKQQLLSDYPEIGDSISDMVEAILEDESLSDGIEDENDVMDRVEELIQETLTQRDIISVINDINPDHANNNDLIFLLSDQIRQNPDLDEEDVRDILSELIRPKSRVQSTSQNERQSDIRTLSNKARQGSEDFSLRAENASPYELLTQKLMEHKKENQKTPLYKR